MKLGLQFEEDDDGLNTTIEDIQTMFNNIVTGISFIWHRIQQICNVYYSSLKNPVYTFINIKQKSVWKHWNILLEKKLFYSNSFIFLHIYRNDLYESEIILAKKRGNRKRNRLTARQRQRRDKRDEKNFLADIAEGKAFI